MDEKGRAGETYAVTAGSHALVFLLIALVASQGGANRIRFFSGGSTELDGDEILALVVSSALTLWGASSWYRSILRTSWLKRRAFLRILLAITPLVCLCLIEGILRRFAAPEVRESVGYQILFLAGGGAWLTATCLVLPFFGIDPRGDVLERGNRAVAAIMCAAFAGVTLCYGGANIGEGETIWTTFLPAMVATSLFLGIWGILIVTTRIATAIAIERRLLPALLLSAMLIANGLILGRAAAGNWVSLEHTMADFVRLGWPAALLTGVIAILYRAWDCKDEKTGKHCL